MTRRLIVFARAPLPGEAKTRLASAVGEREAAGVYARLLYRYLLALAQAHWRDVTLQLSVASRADVPYFAEAFPEFSVRVQCAGDLGKRLAGAFEEAFVAGARSVVVTASDIPDIDAPLIRRAFWTLEEAQGVIGPCPDGGYYLLGLRAPGAPLFDGVSWGSDRVLAQTEVLARAAGLTLVHLPERMDVDTAADWTQWRRRV
ncbi:MAG: TIGR04282 family arsenosugar biosynthesis glycosyltransferase [Anaerolineae bacterium]|nr:TIGR04282 family arsenosugar biosynthesis glycosyltransferase [Anaerolineae bacterium]